MAQATATRKTSNKVKAEARDIVRTAASGNVFNFAKSLGVSQRKTLQDSEKLHKAYAKASEERQAQMKIEFITGYMAGQLGVSKDVAETLASAPRSGADDKVVDGKTIKARTQPQQQAYDRARKQFSFHITREDSRLANGQFSKGSKNPYKKDDPRITEDFKASVVKTVESVYGKVNKTNIEDYAYAILAMAKSMK